MKYGGEILFYYTDIHCHILNGVDDGPASLEDAQKMIDIAYCDGVRHICFTPHFKMFHFKDEERIIKYNNSIKQAFDLCVAYANEKYPDLKLCLGNEIMYHSDILNSLSVSHCASLNGTKYILVEFSPSTAFYEMKSRITSLVSHGYFPIIAHIERYHDILHKCSRVAELRGLHALIQVNAETVACHKFGRTAFFINKLFKKSLVDIVASDAHDTSKYPPILSSACSKITKKYGRDMAYKVCNLNPEAILNNKILF